MKRWIASLLAFGLSNLALVLTIFRPVSNLPAPETAPVHPLIAFAVYISLAVWLFDWTARKIGNAWHAALALGGAQFLLVNVDMVLRGDRAIETAVVSTAIMLVTWLALAAAWQWARGKPDGP